MSDDLTITKKDAELIAEIVVLKMGRILQEKISKVIEEELSPLLEEMVKSITSSYKSLNEIQNFMSSMNKASARPQAQSSIREGSFGEERGMRKKGFKNLLKTGDMLGDQYTHAPNRHPRSADDLLEGKTKTRAKVEESSWDDEDEDNGLQDMFSINDKLIEEEERLRRKVEAEERFNRMNGSQFNEEQSKNIEHDHGAQGGFVEDFLKENAPAYAQGSRSRKRSSMGPIAPEREEDLMDEVIDDDVRRVMQEEVENPSPIPAFDSTASYDEFFIPPDVNVAEVSMPNMSQARPSQAPPARGENVGFRDGSGWEPIPPPEIA